ncbi:mannose-1-phosphate guanylyltransferase/mannose-6-phosphate isomerase [Dendrosporobacter sp. 1207_IL3150]|uniref:mannose-1-phosphate guanylyltransferase/mannose-6-phosphate isomerase n=1 Tax=Dendrosporobacter sp. 1207_IL3150 TaxID=3084054 RepID=UPI002FD8DCAF
MKVIILAGGGGSRLFPLSRVGFPKQFLNIAGNQTLLKQTILRFKPFVKASDIIIITNKDYYHYVNEHIKTCNVEGTHILIEPEARNTAPAIALAVCFCLNELKVSENEFVLVTPSDHVIADSNSLSDVIRKLEKLGSQNYLVTLGVKPDKPETGYGYIKTGKALEIGFVVEAFKEKPDIETARSYIEDGNFYWNSGMFGFTIKFILSQLEEHCPELYTQTKDYNIMMDRFCEMPNISFDYAIAEKVKSSAMLPLGLYWNDVGSWDAIYEVLPKDDMGNVLSGDCTAIDCEKTMMMGNNRLITGVGVKDLVVIETADVILVAQRGETQKVKDLVAQLKNVGRTEAKEHTTKYRSWGNYTIICKGQNYKIKKIVVNPGQCLTLQLHYHRSEHWIIIRGTARVAIGEKEHFISENESIFVPPSTKHRLENPGRINLEIIEIQNGKYLEEDDIVRFGD